MEKILIGKIVKPQGLNGELKVFLYLNDSESLKDLKEIFINDKQIPTKIKSFDIRGGFMYLTLGNVNDRNKADLMRGFEIYADKEDISLAEGNFLIDNLIGASVYSEEGVFIGKLMEVVNFGASDIFTIEEEGRYYDIPYISTIVTKVNDKTKLITVNKKEYDEVKLCE